MITTRISGENQQTGAIGNERAALEARVNKSFNYLINNLDDWSDNHNIRAASFSQWDDFGSQSRLHRTDEKIFSLPWFIYFRTAIDL